MFLVGPIARVRIGDDEFQTGDRLLRYVSVTLGEDARASKCRFEIYDPGLLLADKYFKMSFEQGGIQVPADLLEAPPIAAAIGGGGGLTPAGSPTMMGGAISPDAAQKLILAECAKQGVTDPDQIAYILATAQHESDQFNTLTEYASGEAYEGRGDLGNNNAGDGVRYKGRGYVQLTGRTNYQKYSELTGVDLVANPEKASDPGLAAFILVHGMKTGTYTGARLDEYVGNGRADFHAARAVVNDGDRADLIADYAANWRKKLPPPGATPQQQQADPQQKAAAAQPVIKDQADSKPQEVSNKGTEIIIELGYDPKQLIAYHFIHTGTSTQGRQLDSTVFEGQTVRWLMTRRTKNTSHGNLTVKDLARQIAQSYGLDLFMEGEGPKLQHIDQTGLTDFELLMREAKTIGYSVQDAGATLVLKPPRPEFTNFCITPDILISLQFTDRASRDRQGGGTQTTASQPATTAAENKLRIDRLSGLVQQMKPEDSTGTGKAPFALLQMAAAEAERREVEANNATKVGAQGTIGANNPATNAFVARFWDAAGFSAIAAASSASVAAMGAAQKQPAITGSATPPVSGTPAPAAAKQPLNQGGVLPESVTGLPRQEVGAIDLEDGKAEALELKNEARRIKAYESRATVKTTLAALTLAPGSIIGISKDCVPETFAREWRLASVTHTLQSGLKTELEFYTPQAMKPEAKVAPAATTTGTTPAGNLLSSQASSSGWASPMPIAGNSSCGPVCEFGYARGRLHAGIDYGGFGSGSDSDGVFAASNGKVVYAGLMGGYGNTVDIKRPDGWSSRYAHLAKIDVQEGQEVQQGVRVGTRGGTGEGGAKQYDEHLHFEIRDPGGEPKNPRDYLPQPQLPMA